ncbi:MAG: mannose-1-phosphate guanylyltransferase/mannose-6-phosphate isomerase [Deltaproteobacteria bacterium]|nr:mannose-1-phosphate guanylyltransferase/mannose-6-phosphate isomerase [Deltaproteobacteria bacterium]
MPCIIPVILCGGSGTRLWPLSRENYPKQFVDMGGGRTLFGDTLERALQVAGVADPVVVCNEAHRFYVAAELYKRGVKATVLLEPEGRNTAPALALAAFAALERNREALLLALPSDHALGDVPVFLQGVEEASAIASQGYIVTFGIRPTGPETGFGYIEQGEGFHVARFVEKPDRKKAEAMLVSGGHYWNSGMFVMPAQLYMDELKTHAVSMFTQCARAWMGREADGAFIRPMKDDFLRCSSDSIDYAVMEHTSRAAVVPLDLAWSDLGSWEAFYEAGERDAQGNVARGDVLLEDAAGCYCNARSRLLACIGVRDMLVVETQDAVLVAPRKAAQRVKEVALRLRNEGRKEYREPPLVYRPWGSYEILVQGERFQVKRIVVHPGAQLSLQMHHHRAEHWVVVSGTAEVTKGEETRLYTENQSTYIPVGTKHMLKNPGLIPLVLIEIQSGAYLGEDDIVRFADMYGRKE